MTKTKTKTDIIVRGKSKQNGLRGFDTVLYHSITTKDVTYT